MPFFLGRGLARKLKNIEKLDLEKLNLPRGDIFFVNVIYKIDKREEAKITRISVKSYKSRYKFPLLLIVQSDEGRCSETSEISLPILVSDNIEIIDNNADIEFIIKYDSAEQNRMLIDSLLELKKSLEPKMRYMVYCVVAEQSEIRTRTSKNRFYLHRLNDLDFVKGYGTETRISDKLIVKSKLEEIIAKILIKNNINFEYEKEVMYNNKKYLPDFYLADYNCYIEVWGVPEDNSKIDSWMKKFADEYRRNMKIKIDIYARLGLHIIGLYSDQIKKTKKFEKSIIEQISRYSKE